MKIPLWQRSDMLPTMPIFTNIICFLIWTSTDNRYRDLCESIALLLEFWDLLNVCTVEKIGQPMIEMMLWTSMRLLSFSLAEVTVRIQETFLITPSLKAPVLWLRLPWLPSWERPCIIGWLKPSLKHCEGITKGADTFLELVGPDSSFVEFTGFQ